MRTLLFYTVSSPSRCQVAMKIKRLTPDVRVAIDVLKLTFGKTVLINQWRKVSNQRSDRKSHQIPQKG